MYCIILAGKDLKDEINLIKRTLDETPNTVFGGDFSGSTLITNNFNITSVNYTL